MLIFTAVCYFFLKSSGMTHAMDEVLVLDTKNLKGYWDDHGSDYSVTLAKEDSRLPLPRKYTICNSGFFGTVTYKAENPKKIHQV